MSQAGTDHVIKKGYLDVLPLSPLDKAYVPMWQSRFFVLLGSSESAQGRLIHFEDEAAYKRKRNIYHHDFYMEEIDKVKMGGEGPHDARCFQVRKTNQSADKRYRAGSEDEAREWFSMLRENIDAHKQYRRRGNPLAAGVTKTTPSAPSEKALFEYRVTSQETDASIICKIVDGNSYLLRINTENIELWTEDNRRMCTWPYKFIRRLGSSSSSFLLEAGRRAETGEGVFIFLSDQSATILKEAQATNLSVNRRT